MRFSAFLISALYFLAGTAWAEPLVFSDAREFRAAPKASDLGAWINSLASRRKKPVEMKVEKAGPRLWRVSLKAGENQVSGTIDYFEEPSCDQAADYLTAMALRQNVSLEIRCSVDADHRWKFQLRSYPPGNERDHRVTGTARKPLEGFSPAFSGNPAGTIAVPAK